MITKEKLGNAKRFPAFRIVTASKVTLGWSVFKIDEILGRQVKLFEPYFMVR